MSKFRLRRGVPLGSLAAENDSMLGAVFLDVGYLERLEDPSESAFLILGRAGSGKTALIRTLKERNQHVVQIDPDELSMQYLQNSVLRTIASWGVNLDIFYKYLWRHICILELIRMRYGSESELPQSLLDLTYLRDRLLGNPTKEASKSYLADYGQSYWVKTDTRVRTITSEIESRIDKDAKLSASLKTPVVNLSGSAGVTSGARTLDREGTEIVERAQQIVSDFQIADLNRVVDALSRNGFSNPQNPYFIVIDDLDKNWMPDDSLYLELIKSLLLTVRDLNYRLPNVKIIIALREDIAHRVFKIRSRQEQQQEKWADVQLRILWTGDQLVELVDKRLAEVYRSQYTKQPPKLIDLLPSKRPNGDDPLQFLIERTLNRPRDIIDFLNRCFDKPSEVSRLSLADIRNAEVGYSKARLQAIFDEWAGVFPGLDLTVSVIRAVGPRFTPSQITDDIIMEMFVEEEFSNCPWLVAIAEEFDRGGLHAQKARASLLIVWFLTGIVGIKGPYDP